MFKSLFGRIVGDANEREINGLRPTVEKTNALEPEFEALTDDELRGKTDEFLKRLDEGEAVEDLLPEAFSAAREASKRTLGQRPRDVQLLGGLALIQGKMVEMKTGEGKTLMATLPLYLVSLQGKGAHLVTVNDYLARRDVQWMGPIYHLLGLQVGLLQQGGEAFLFDPNYTRGKFLHLRSASRRAIYMADITYGTNNEFGFDYLRDNLALTVAGRVQRGLHYALVDEVDNVFIDQARTPLIISGQLSREDQKKEADEYRRFAGIASRLEMGPHYELDEREQNVTLTEEGLGRVEAETGITNIYDEANYYYVHFMEQALRARVLFLKARDYLVQSRRVILIDQFTGRLMPDRRLSEGLHQAIEAKEGVEIRPRLMTHATITIQNYFRMYEKLAGMTGTAATEAEEFYKIYACDTIVLPTHVEYRAMRGELVTERSKKDGIEVVTYRHTDDPEELYFKRIDFPDVIYGTEKAKWQAIVQEIERCYQTKRPVLVGTTSVEKSEVLSRRLRSRNIKHQVLYAKEHAKEASIIARAGWPGVVTIATQMAGRGVDIKLGGELSDETVARARQLLESRGFDFFYVTTAQLYNTIAEIDPAYVRRREEVLKLGGLHIIGTERYEARRIDNQLRGRAGRQGEAGSSRFYLSLEDDLMRRFGGERVKGLMERLRIEDDIPIEHGLVTKTIEAAQTRVEGHNFDIRKHLLEYDDVLSRQRELIYGQRDRILTSSDLSSDLGEMIEKEIDKRLEKDSPEPDHEWALWRSMDDYMPLLPVLLPSRRDKSLPKVPFPPPFSLPTNWRCFPPFTISFLAERMQSSSPEDWGEEILDLHPRAAEEYRDYLLEKVVSEPLQKVEEEYQENLEKFAELLEQKVDDYYELAEERGRAIHARDLLQHLQRTFPLSLEVRHQELRGLELDEIVERLLAALDHSYNQRICDSLIQSIQARTPAALKLENVRSADLDGKDVEKLLAQATANARDEQAKAALTKIARGMSEGKRRRTRDDLIGLLEQLSNLAHLEIGGLEPLLRQAMSLAYTRWAERQLQEITKSVKESLETFSKETLMTGSVQQATQLLLDAYYARIQSFDKGHRRQTSPVPRFPPSFLVALKMRGTDSQELRRAMQAHLRTALNMREQLWSEQELGRWSQQRLEDLGRDFGGDLAEFLGESRIRVIQNQPVGEWNEGLRKALLHYLRIQTIEKERLADLEPVMRDAMRAHLENRLEEQIGGQRFSDLDKETRRRIEEFLHGMGYFEDKGAEQRLFTQRISDLDTQVVDGLAHYLGKRRLEDIERRPIGHLEPGERQAVREYLQRRGYFTDNKKVQNFLVYQRPADLESEIFYQACSFLARKQMASARNREIGRLGVGIRRVVMACLREAHLFDNEEQRRAVAAGRLVDLDEETLIGFLQELGQYHFAGGKSIAELEEEIRRHVLDDLKREQYFQDRAAMELLPKRRLSELGGDLYAEAQQLLLSEMLASLEEKDIGALEPYLQEWVRDYLDEMDYLVDKAQVRQFRSQPLAQVRLEFVPGLEEHLGREWMVTFDSRPFLEVDQEIRESILQHLQVEGYFEDKAAEKRFIYNHTLADLDGEIYKELARYLGRQRWREIKGRWFGGLSEDTQQSIWRYLKEVRYFVDAELEQLLPHVKIAALEDEIHKAMSSYLGQKLEKALTRHPIGALPAGVQAHIRRYLDERDYFVDRSKLKEFVRKPATELETEIYEITTRYLGQHLSAQYAHHPIPELSREVQELLWDYLDRLDYFVDETKQRGYAQTHLRDLPPQVYELIVLHLGRKLQQEIGGRRVAELEDDLKQGLQQYFRLIELEDNLGQDFRPYLAQQDYFVDEEKLVGLDNQTLAEWREEAEGLILLLGRRQLKAVEGQRLADLSPEAQASIRDYIREEDYCRDEGKYRAFKQQTLADLDEHTRAQVFRILYQEQERSIDHRHIGDLDEETRRSIWQFLEDWALESDKAQMYRLESQTPAAWEQQFYNGFARFLGARQMEDRGNERIAELDEETQEAAGAFLGRQVMHNLQKNVILQSISRLWIDYLTDIEDLRQGIGLQAYGQRDPLVEYKRQAFEMFDALQDRIHRSVVATVFRSLPQPLRITRGSD